MFISTETLTLAFQCGVVSRSGTHDLVSVSIQNWILVTLFTYLSFIQFAFCFVIQCLNILGSCVCIRNLKFRNFIWLVDAEQRRSVIVVVIWAGNLKLSQMCKMNQFVMPWVPSTCNNPEILWCFLNFLSCVCFQKLSLLLPPPALISYIRPVFVLRSDQDSRRKTVEEIKRRAKSEGEWPQVQSWYSNTYWSERVNLKWIWTPSTPKTLQTYSGKDDHTHTVLTLLPGRSWLGREGGLSGWAKQTPLWWRLTSSAHVCQPAWQMRKNTPA